MTAGIERLQQAIAKAAQDLERAMAHGAEVTGPPSPSDLFVFDTGEVATLEWLVVREHLDDLSILLIVPLDDFPLTGTPDVELPRDLVERPLTARCGEALWVPADFCQPRLRTGTVPAETLGLVRRRIAELARGRADERQEHRSVDMDPEYEEWMVLVARARERLQQRADQAPIERGPVIPFEQLSSRLPAEMVAESQYALAAESGSPLLTALAEALSDAEATTRYHEIDLESRGKIILLTSDAGVRAVWSGATGIGTLKLLGRGMSGEVLEAAWQLGPEGKLQRAEPIFPWVDGQVTLTIATEPPRTVTVQR